MTFSEVHSSPLILRELAGRLVGCGARVIGDDSVSVNHVTEDSRRIRVGSLFVARRGQKSDGTQFVSAALENGACAILCEKDGGVTAEPRLEVNDLREAWGQCAQELYSRPADSLKMVGITGTNGKTTVASLVAQALSSLGELVARSGTLGFFVGEQRLGDSLTTPQPDQLAEALAVAHASGASAAIMEVSSHALDQKRVAGIHFTVGAVTNLSQDHLDYHDSMEAYGEAKARLFAEPRPLFQVLNIDDAFGRSLAKRLPEAILISAQGATSASIRCEEVVFGRDGIRAQITCGTTQLDLFSPLLGRHNLENLLVAWGILEALGVSGVDAARCLGQAKGVAGRLERCESGEDDVTVVVDYAHTPDALDRALRTLVDLGYEEVVCVFGCGGDRDRKKRVPMGQAAALLADRVILTSDNPRTEDPIAILEEVRPGLDAARRTPVVEVDRHSAIQQAVLAAAPGAVVLIAGKGHEDYQLIGNQVLHFDDREEAREALALRRAQGRGATR